MTRPMLFTLTDEAYENLKNLERGSRSRIISDFLEQLNIKNQTSQETKEQKDFHNGNNGAGASSKPNGSLENSTTPSNDQEASQCKSPASEQNILRKLSNLLR